MFKQSSWKLNLENIVELDFKKQKDHDAKAQEGAAEEQVSVYLMTFLSISLVCFRQLGSFKNILRRYFCPVKVQCYDLVKWRNTFRV